MDLGVLIRQLQGMQPSRGRAAVHYSTSNLSDVTTIAHGLGVVPSEVVITGEDSAGAVTVYVVGAKDDVNFTCWGRDVQGAVRGPGDLMINWVAYP